MSTRKSLLDYAFEYIQKQDHPVSFKEIWNYVVTEANLSPSEVANKIGQFYTNLTLDGRFVNLNGSNNWYLKEKVEFAKYHIEVPDEEDDVGDDDDDTEDKEYNAVFQDKEKSSNEDSSDEEAEENEQ